MATTSQTILWTALPRQRQDTLLELSVYVSPRLVTEQPNPTLDVFPDFVHWADKVNTVNFKVLLGTTSCEARRISPAARPDLWDALFTTKALTRSHTFDDYTDRILRSYPVRPVLRFIRDVYTQIAEVSPTELPSLEGDPALTLSGLLAELGSVREHAGEFGTQLENSLATDKVVTPGNLYGFANSTQLAFHQAGRFYGRPENKQDQLHPPPPSAPPQVPIIDFHQMVTRLADYPTLLRLLGLVVDLQVDLQAVNVPPASTVQIVPVWDPKNQPVWFNNVAPDPTHRDSLPATRYQLTPESFMAAPRQQSDLTEGMLKLNGEDFDFFQVDVDGAALKVFDFALNMQRTLKPDNRSYTTPDRAGLPALRTGGFSVARNTRAFQLSSHLKRAKAHNNTLAGKSEPELFADELVRGYRVDVFDDRSKQWHSLCWRNATYEFVDTHTLQLAEEGYIKGASATSATTGAAPDLYLHEAVFGWDGWSLCAARPERTIVSVQQGGQQVDRPARVPNTAATEFQLQTHFRVLPGTLPLLRYGVTYRLRARAVDLAGNSLPATLADNIHVTRPQTYGRFEPVASPVLVPRAAISEGESLERMVIRSNFNITAEGYVQLRQVHEALEGKWYTYQPVNERHVVPPKTSQLMAELHGMFDPFIGTGKDYQQGFHIAVKEEGTLLDTLIVDTNSGQKTIPVVGLELVTPPSVQPAPGQTLPKLPLIRGQALAPGQYAIHTEDKLLLPYLPDVLARGTTFLGLPGHPAGEVFQAGFDSDNWPYLTPFRLRIAEGDGPPKYDASQGVLTVQLPKATMATVRYSCHLQDGDQELMAIWHWMSEAKKAALKDAVLTGQHWMFTPYRELTMVHAVQQPLSIPTFQNLVLSRKAGATLATFDGFIQNHAPSTGKIDVEARWQETVDPLSKDGPETIEGQAHITDFDVEYTENSVRVEEADTPKTPASPATRRMLHEFGDTKHRHVEYYNVATTRFREYFPSATTADPAAITRSGRSSPVADSAQPYFGTKIAVDIPSSARPEAPKVLYAIPTFGWEKTVANGTVHSTRKGNGIRVYLERPWFSSGDGELLAVLLPDGGILSHIALEPYVTQWGADPIWGSTPLQSPPIPPLTPDTFSPNATVMSGLTLDEVSGETVTAVGLPVEYDATRKLWFCDITLAPTDIYTPFIRLALARFQPHSLPNAHLSRVVLTDFVQLLPDRTAKIEYEPSSSRLLVTVSGVYGFHEFTKRVTPPNTSPLSTIDSSRIVQAHLEIPDPRVGGDLGWSKVANKAITFPAVKLEEGNTMVWHSAISFDGLAKPKSQGGQQVYRVLIQEFERVPTDEDVRDVSLPIFFLGSTKVFMRSRLVYTDAVEI